MKTLELERMNLVELTQEERESSSGGWWQAAIAIAGVIIYLYNNADDFAKGFREGQAAYNAGK